MLKRAALTAMILAMALSLMACSAAPQQQQTAAAGEKQSVVGYYFDTVVTLTLYDPPEGFLDELLTHCERYEKLLSKTVEGSDVYRINHAEGEPVTVDPETWNILRRAKEISAATGGAFSVTIAPLTAQWDFTSGTAIVPAEEVLQPLLSLVDDSAIELGENSTVRLPKDMQIDLGGIAKGYIADQIAAICREKGFSGTLNFGGNVYAVGEKPGGNAFAIGVTDPKNKSGNPIVVLSVKDMSVVTSGTYERFFIKDDVLYHHILDPKTGSPARTDLAGITIVNASSMDADAFATACIVLGHEGSEEILKANDLDALLINTDNEIYLTPGFADLYPLSIVK